MLNQQALFFQRNTKTSVIEITYAKKWAIEQVLPSILKIGALFGPNHSCTKLGHACNNELSAQSQLIVKNVSS